MGRGANSGLGALGTPGLFERNREGMSPKLRLLWTESVKLEHMQLGHRQLCSYGILACHPSSSFTLPPSPSLWPPAYACMKQAHTGPSQQVGASQVVYAIFARLGCHSDCGDGNSLEDTRRRWAWFVSILSGRVICAN